MDDRLTWFRDWWRSGPPARPFWPGAKLALGRSVAATCLLSGQVSPAQATLTANDGPPTSDMTDNSAPIAAFRFDGGPEATYSFSGSGFGHGVGMSQWGARGRADAGQDASAILSAYYTGVTISDDLAYSPVERVLVYHGPWPSNNARIDVMAGVVQLPGSSQPLTSGAHVELKLPPKGQPSLQVFDAVGAPTSMVGLDSPVTLHASDTSRLRMAFKSGKSPRRRLDTYNVYRGDLTLLATPTSLEVIDLLPLDQYLYGSVPAEMPARGPLRRFAHRRSPPERMAFTPNEATPHHGTWTTARRRRYTSERSKSSPRRTRPSTPRQGWY